MCVGKSSSKAIAGHNFEKLDLYMGPSKELHLLAGRARGWWEVSAVWVKRHIQPLLLSLPAVSSRSWQLEITEVDVPVIYAAQTS